MDNFTRLELNRAYTDVCEWGVVLYDETKRVDEHSERVQFIDYFDMVYCCIVIDGQVAVCEYVSDNKELIQMMKMYKEDK